VNDQLRYSKSDTVGATKTIIEARVFKMNKDRLESNPELVNFSEKFNNTSLGAYYKNSVELALDMFSNLFLSETKAVKNTVEGILGYLGADPDEQQRVADNVYAYLMAEKYGVDREEFNSLFYGDKSMVRRFSALKYGLNEEIKSRPLIKYLTTKRGGTRLPDFIGVTKSKQVSVHVQNMIYRDWEDMLSSSDPEIKKFAEDLIKYSYLTSGFMNGLYTFHEYIPTSWMKDNNLDKFISTKMQELDKNEFVMENFINQYYRNNPGLITQLKMKSPFKETIPSPTVEVNGIKVPSMVGVKMSDGGNKYINSVTGAKPYLMYSNNLYKLKGYRIEDGILKGAEYVITEKLGYNALGRKIIEYYPGQANPRSAVKSNVVNISNADIKLIQDKTKDLLPHKEFIEKVNESSNELPFGILPKNDNNSEESDGLTRVCEIE
jgi:hypothetical protein